MPMNLLITGGAGYIGSHTILELLNCGHSVVCVDNCSNAFKSEKDDLPESLIRVQEITGKKLKFYQVNLCERDALDRVFKSVSLEIFPRMQI
jgi:UDP-glucose 4-epimerase